MLRTTMILHHHHNSSLQKKLWCSNVQSLLFSLKRASLQASPWRGSLRQAGFVSATAATTYHPIRGATLIDIIGVFGGGGWGLRLYSRRWCNFGVGGMLLTHIFFFIRVAEDDDFAITGQLKDTAVEVTKKSPDELLILLGIIDETFFIRR
jgi:hypothetical protein